MPCVVEITPGHATARATVNGPGSRVSSSGEERPHHVLRTQRDATADAANAMPSAVTANGVTVLPRCERGADAARVACERVVGKVVCASWLGIVDLAMTGATCLAGNSSGADGEVSVDGGAKLVWASACTVRRR